MAQGRREEHDPHERSERLRISERDRAASPSPPGAGSPRVTLKVVFSRLVIDEDLFERFSADPLSVDPWSRDASVRVSPGIVFLRGGSPNTDFIDWPRQLTHPLFYSISGSTSGVFSLLPLKIHDPAFLIDFHLDRDSRRDAAHLGRRNVFHLEGLG